MAGVQSGTHSWELSLSLVMLALTPGNVRIELDSRALRYAREGKKKPHIFDVRNVEFNLFVALHCCHFVVQHGVHCALFGQVNGSGFSKSIRRLKNFSTSALRCLGPENSSYLNEVWQFTQLLPARRQWLPAPDTCRYRCDIKNVSSHCQMSRGGRQGAKSPSAETYWHRIRLHQVFLKTSPF